MTFTPDRNEIYGILTSPEVQRGLLEVAEAGAEAARAAAPRDTGALADSIEADSERGRAAFYFTAPHGIFVETGTANMAARPFMRGAGLEGAKRAAG